MPKLLGKLIVNVSSGNGVSGLYEFGLREPAEISLEAAPYAGSHRFYAAEANSDFSDPKYGPALGLAWSVPEQNMAFAAEAAAK